VFLLATGTDPQQRYRVGITVSRKVGGAVVRNRAKRLLREALRRLPGLVAPGVDLVVVVRRPLADLKTAQVADECESISKLLARKSDAVTAHRVVVHGDGS